MTPSLYTKECGVVIDFSESWALMLTGHGITDNPNRVSWNEGWVPLRNLKKANGNICWAKKKKQTKKQKKKPQKWPLKASMCAVLCSVFSHVQLTLWNPLDCSSPGYCVLGVLFRQEYWKKVAISSYRGSIRPKDWTLVSCVACIVGQFFTTEPSEKQSTINIIF